MLSRLFLLICLLASCVGAQNGRIKVHFVQPQTQIALAFHQEMVNDQAQGIQTMMNGISDMFMLPRDIKVIFAQTGDINAWYDPEKHQVVMTYDFIEFIIKHGLQHKSTSAEAVDYATGAIFFTLMHELGHCLIGEMDMPVVGREEDAADEFASVILLEMGDRGHQILASAADWFQQMSQGRQELSFWDEHSLDQQRVFNILLLMYGHSPNKYASYVSKVVPRERMAKALHEYKQKNHRWEKLLTPYVRK